MAHHTIHHLISGFYGWSFVQLFCIWKYSFIAIILHLHSLYFIDLAYQQFKQILKLIMSCCVILPSFSFILISWKSSHLYRFSYFTGILSASDYFYFSSSYLLACFLKAITELANFQFSACSFLYCCFKATTLLFLHLLL